MGLKPYTIWSPEYSQFSGGIRALHVLEKELKKRDIEVCLHYKNIIPESITIYPEIIKENPLESKNIVHWLLNKSEFKELSFAWAKGMGVHNLLTVNIYELDIFYPRTKQRSGIGYWVGKGIVKQELLPENAQRIQKFEPNTRESLAELLSSFEYVISFDEFSGINTECLLLGTPVLIYPTTNWSKKEILNLSVGVSKFAWDLQELEIMRSKVNLAFEEYKAFLPVFDKRIDLFIELTQKEFST